MACNTNNQRLSARVRAFVATETGASGTMWVSVGALVVAAAVIFYFVSSGGDVASTGDGAVGEAAPAAEAEPAAEGEAGATTEGN